MTGWWSWEQRRRAADLAMPSISDQVKPVDKLVDENVDPLLGTVPQPEASPLLARG